MRTSGVNPTSRMAVATCDAASSGRPSHSASSVRVACTGPMNWTSAARSASGCQGTQALGGLGEPAAGHRETAQQLLLEDLVDPERPDVRRRGGGRPRWHPSARAGTGIRRCRRGGACRRTASGPGAPSVRPRPTPPRRPPRGDRRHRGSKTRLACARPMSSTMPTSSAIPSATRRSSMPSSISPSVLRPIPRVLRAWPSMSRAPTARAAVRASFAHVRDSSNLAPSIRIWARPAIARARATEGGSGGIRRTAAPVGPLRHLALAGDPGAAPEPLVEQARPRRVRRLVDELDRRLDQRDGARRVVEAGDPGRLGQRLDPVMPDPGLGVGDLAPQLQDPLVLGEGLREGVAPLRRDARDGRGLESARQVVRRIPVIGQLGRAGRVAAGARLERPRERGVQSRPLPGQQVVVDRLLEQRVAEGVALAAGRRIGDQDLPVDALAERVVERRLVEGGRGREQRRVDPLAGRRRDAQELLGGLGQLGDPCQQQVAQRRRQLAGSVGAVRPAAPRRRRRCRPTGRGSIRRGPASRSWPAIARSCSADSPRSNGTTSRRSTRPDRSSSARNGSSGWRRCSSSDR